MSPFFPLCGTSNKDGAKPFVEDMEAGKGKTIYLDISVRHRDTDSDIKPTGSRPETLRYTEMGDACGESREFKFRLPLG